MTNKSLNYDKYKGHYKERLAVASRKGSWDWVIYLANDPNQEVCQMTHDGIDQFNEVGEATAHLFADSPLILQRCMELEERVGAFVDALIWCSGSSDFGEDGQARVGWLKICQPLLDQALSKQREGD